MTACPIRDRLSDLICELRDGDHAYVPDSDDDGQREAAAATQADVATVLRDVVEMIDWLCDGGTP